MLSTPHLPRDIKGRILLPDDPGYDDARTVFAGAIDRRPGMIVRAADAADVARVVSLARETGSELAVRSGGHSPAGHGVSEGGIVLDLSAMRGLEIDAERAHRLGRDRPHRGRVHGGGRRARPRHRLRRRRHGRRRRDHAERRDRIPRAQARHDHRRPAGRGGRDGRRRAAPRRRGQPPGPVLGAPRRRRELRRRHAAQVPPARGRPDRRRAAVPARDAGRDRLASSSRPRPRRRSSRRSPT